MTACSGCRKLGYKGLLEANFSPLSARDVGGIIQQGGTIFRHRSLLGIEDPEVIQQAISALKNDSIDGLVVYLFSVGFTAQRARET
jgi:6-phosphofructokinase 1